MTTDRFAFGKNWTEYVQKHMSNDAVASARQALLALVRLPSLDGLRVLDIGCGSGIHSLAAHQAGAAEVVSFDYDMDSVNISRTLHRQAGSPANWTVEQGSVLDKKFMQQLGQFDLVYSWGVLHHTGNMMEALANAVKTVALDGLFALALYSYTAYYNGTVFGQPSPEDWLIIKQNYVEGDDRVKRRLVREYIWRHFFARAGGNPFKLVNCAVTFFSRWINYGKQSRGMNFFTDIRDWVGGWPMEFMSERDCLSFADSVGFELLSMQTGRGNTEYLFRPQGGSNHWDALIAQRERTVLSAPYEQVADNVWRVDVPQSIPFDTVQNPFCSPLRLTEDGQAWGFAHCHWPALEAFGEGRYRHEEGSLLFATSDNSDPNTNGREYAWFLE